MAWHRSSSNLHLLNTDLTEVEIIHLFNDGVGLGFGLIGSKSTGVVVRTILPGGAAHQNGRLLVGDHIMFIDDLAVRGMTSEQVATVLRQAGSNVRMIVARPWHHTTEYLASVHDKEQSTLIPTQQLEEHLEYLSNEMVPMEDQRDPRYSEEYYGAAEDNINIPRVVGNVIMKESNYMEPQSLHTSMTNTIEYFDVYFEREDKGLGITVAGYISTSPEIPLHGLFVRSIAPGSPADADGRIKVHDQILKVNNVSLKGLDNHTAVEVLKSAKQSVLFRIARYRKGPIYDQLQSAISSTAPVTSNSFTQACAACYSLPTRAAHHPPNTDHYYYESSPPNKRPYLISSPIVVASPQRASSYSLALEQTVISSPEFAHENYSDYSRQSKSIESPINVELTELLDPADSPYGFDSPVVHTAGCSLRLSEEDLVLSNSAFTQSQLVDRVNNNNNNHNHGNQIFKPLDNIPLFDSPLFIDTETFTNRNEMELMKDLSMPNKHHYIPGSETPPSQPASPRSLMEMRSLMESCCTHCYPSTDGHVPMEIEAALRQTWSKILGPHYYILVAHITKSRDSGGLGISLEGTVDVDARGVENQPHHYIRKILPQGPVGRDGTLRIKDELLEVNGKKLYGFNYKDVVHILKNLPSHVRLVCARRRYDTSASSSSISTVGSEAEFVDTSEIGSTQSSMVAPFKAKSEDSLFSSTIPSRNDVSLKSIRSRSLEHMTGVAIWAKEPLLIELQKEGKGLGFSIVDHADPYNSRKTIIVIRSLVPGGVAHQDGRIIPGDRLLFVNDRSVEHVSLETAVDILKSAPRGKVILGIAKPLPLHPDTATTVSSFKDADIKELNDSFVISKQDDTYDQIPPAPASLEKNVVLWHHEGALEIEVDAVCDGNHGCRIRQIRDAKLLKEGLLQKGDYITEIDSHTMRHISTDQAKDIIDQLASSKPMDIEIFYISSEDVQRHMEHYYNPATHFNSKHSSSSPLLHSLPNNAHVPPSYNSVDLQKRRPTLTRQRSQASTNDVEVWASPRLVIIEREPGSSLGISIVGCKVTDQDERSLDRQINIFIKQLTKNSPADRCAQLKPHDRILQVNGTDLRKCSHDDAVDIIRNATSPVKLLVQSLVEPPEISNDVKQSLEKEKSENQLISSEESLPQSGDALEDAPAPANNEEAILMPHTAIDEDVNGTVESPIQPSSPAETKDESSSESDDNEAPDEWGLTMKSVKKRYDDYPGDILIFRVPCTDKTASLGLRLAGNKDAQKMNVFVQAIVPESLIDLDGNILVGDELLEINDESLVGRSHLNISPIIKRCQLSKSQSISFVVHRCPDNIETMAAPLSSTSSSKRKVINSELPPTKKPTNEEVIHVSLVRGSTGLGFFIMDGSMSDEPGIYVKLITPNGVADKEGSLRQGDRLLYVNNTDVTQKSYDDTLELLRQPTPTAHLVVSRPAVPPADIVTQTLPHTKRASLSTTKAIVSGAPNEEQSSPPPVAEAPPEASTLPRVSLTGQEKSFDLSSSDKRFQSIRAQIRPSNGSPVSQETATPIPNEIEQPLPRLEIEPGKETEIELIKEGSLGFSIVCGSDKTHGTVIVYEVHDNGLADIDGRLETGDRILEVNGTDIRAASHEEAINVLRNAGKTVRLKVFRDSPEQCKEDHLYEIRSVDLVKKTKKGLGISIVSKPNVGVIISELVKDSIAEQNGGLQKGDLILEIDGENVRESSQQQVATILKRHTGKVNILVGRPKSGAHSRSSSQSRLNKEHKKDADNISQNRSIYIGGTDTESTYSSRSARKSSHKVGIKTNSIPENLQSLKTKNSKIETSPSTSIDSSQNLRWDVTLTRGPQGLGFTIVGGPETPLTTYHVKTVVPHGPASKCHIQSGDRILAVNGVLVDNKERSQVIAMLKTSEQTITITLSPGVDDVMKALETLSCGTIGRY